MGLHGKNRRPGGQSTARWTDRAGSVAHLAEEEDRAAGDERPREGGCGRAAAEGPAGGHLVHAARTLEPRARGVVRLREREGRAAHGPALEARREKRLADQRETPRHGKRRRPRAALERHGAVARRRRAPRKDAAAQDDVRHARKDGVVERERPLLDDERALKRDSVLRKVIKQIGSCTLEPVTREPYEALVRAIAHQQVHGRAAEAILGRLLALLPAHGFPPPETILAMEVEAMRGCGFSGSKVAAIRDIAEKSVGGLVPTREGCARYDDAALIEQHRKKYMAK